MIVVKIIELDIDKKSTVSQILKNKILLTQILKMKEDFQKEIKESVRQWSGVIIHGKEMYP